MTYIKNIPKGQNVISTRWVITTKTDEDNNIIKFKAPLVARGFKTLTLHIPLHYKY